MKTCQPKAKFKQMTISFPSLRLNFHQVRERASLEGRLLSVSNYQYMETESSDEGPNVLGVVSTVKKTQNWTGRVDTYINENNECAMSVK